MILLFLNTDFASHPAAAICSHCQTFSSSNSSLHKYNPLRVINKEKKTLMQISSSSEINHYLKLQVSLISVISFKKNHHSQNS